MNKNKTISIKNIFVEHIWMVFYNTFHLYLTVFLDLEVSQYTTRVKQNQWVGSIPMIHPHKYPTASFDDCSKTWKSRLCNA